MKKVLSVLLALLLPAAFAWGLAEEEPLPPLCGDYYYVLLEDGTAEIWSYIGEEENVVIPGTLDGVPVTSVGEVSFALNDTLKSVTIPEGVTHIGDSAFFGCVALAEISVPDSVDDVGANPFIYCLSLDSIRLSPGHPVLEVVDGVLFDRREARLISYPSGSGSESYEIPEGTRIVGESAFYDCSTLASVTFPESVTVIGPEAFIFCSGLKTVLLPANCSEIGEGAFSECGSLKVTVPEGSAAALCCEAGGIPYQYLVVLEQIGRTAHTTVKVNFREGPGTYYSSLEQLSPGTEVYVIEKVDDTWLHVRYGDQDGYLMAKYIEYD